MMTLCDMVKTMNHGGRMAILGIPPKEASVDWSMIVFKGLVVKGIYGREMYETWYKMIAMLQSGLNLSPIMTHPLQSHVAIHLAPKANDSFHHHSLALQIACSIRQMLSAYFSYR